MVLIVCVLLSQNRDMEPQHIRVVDFGWCLVGFSCIEHTGYVLQPHLFLPLSYVPSLPSRRLDTCEEIFRWSHLKIVRTDTHTKNKLETTYNPIPETCVILHTHRGLANATGILVVDVMLLLTMLIGLLRHPHKSSTGMWKFLYQQVILDYFLLHS
jgi:hypothetical protein